jgi:hypothetical protein
MDYSNIIDELLNTKIDVEKPKVTKLSIHKEIANNISKSQHLRAEINKDITAGADTHSILLKTLECIYLMTGDSVFYCTNKAKLTVRRGQEEGIKKHQ